MSRQHNKERRRAWGLSLLALAMVLTSALACERERPIVENEGPLASEHEPKTELSDEAGSSSYEAARCAARAGDYRQSLFHLQAAASDGFAGIVTIQQDPLFRPLYSGARWQLVVDLVDANDKAMSPEERQLRLTRQSCFVGV